MYRRDLVSVSPIIAGLEDGKDEDEEDESEEGF